MGGMGYMRESLVEWLYRDNHILSIGGSSREIMNGSSASRWAYRFAEVYKRQINKPRERGVCLKQDRGLSHLYLFSLQHTFLTASGHVGNSLASSSF